MTDRYIIEYRIPPLGCWAAIGDEYETPATKSEACAVLSEHRQDDSDEYRVTLLMADNTWTDVTLAILGQIEDDEREAEREAEQDARHERQERHGWEQV